jgi:tetratricopeptide (TPR) repeat protein
MTVLNLIDHLLSRGRRYHNHGQSRLALRTLGRLAGFRSLPDRPAQEVQLRLAEIHLAARRFRKARRHLTAVLKREPDNAAAHHLMAVACQADNRGDLKRAARHFRRALELEPENTTWLGEFGLLGVQLGWTDEALVCLRRACELAPDDPEPLSRLVQGLCQAGQPEQAERELRLMLFRKGRDLRFVRLWRDFQFQQLRQRQELDRLNAERMGPSEEPVLLPFVRVARAEPAGDAVPTILRRDEAGPLTRPHAGPGEPNRVTPGDGAGPSYGP